MSYRSVPLHPQLEAIIWEYVQGCRVREAMTGDAPRALLFPGEGAKGEALLTDFREGARWRGEVDRVEGGRDSVQDVPAHLLLEERLRDRLNLLARPPVHL